MDTTEQPIIDTGRRRRRTYSAHFKAEAVGACQQSGVSVAAVARARGLNANLLGRWVLQAERRNAPIAIQPTSPEPILGTGGFLPVVLPDAPTVGTIRIKIRRRGHIVSIEWPAAAAHECALFLRELMK